MPRTGRRPGAGGTRDKILAAARTHFGKVGYEGGTVRGIAAAAGVDPALVMHYFGRASLAASSLIGLAMLRYVIMLEPVASAPSDQVASWVGPAVQRYLTDPGVTARPPSVSRSATGSAKRRPRLRASKPQ